MRLRLTSCLLLAALAFCFACKAEESPDTPIATIPPATPTQAALVATRSPEEPSPTPSATATAVPDVITVIGDDDFKAWVASALDLLETRAPDAYRKVLESIDVIESVEAGSGIDVRKKHFAVGEQTAYAPGYDEEGQLIWFAGAIAHDAHHSWLFSNGLEHAGKQAEIECLTVQLAAMRLLTDDPYFPGYLQGLIDGADDPANQYWNQPNRHW